MADTFEIDVKHPLYDLFAPSWEMMRDCYDGEDSVKAKGEKYLPMKSGVKAITNKHDRDAAYEAYKYRCEFPELVAPTIRGSLGMIHSKDSVYKMPASIEYVKDRATETGLELSTLHAKVTEEILLNGRYGLLPGLKDGIFYIAEYKAEQIINWDVEDGVLTWLVLDETKAMRNKATNKWENVEQYLALRINEEGYMAYSTYIYTGKKDKDGKKIFSQTQEQVASTPKGPLTIIPFVFAGSMNSDPDPDDIPMYGLGKLALRAYRLDADYVNSLHFTSEPTPYVTGVDKESAPDAIGSQVLWILPGENAKAGMLEFSGPGLSAQDRAITSTFERALMFGAQMFTDNRRNSESGEAVKIRFSSQTSTLKMVAESSAEAVEQCLKNIAIWNGEAPDQVEESVEVIPNLDFIDKQLNHQEILAIVSGWQSGAYSKETMFENLQRGGIIDLSKKFEEEEALIDPRIKELMFEKNNKVESNVARSNQKISGAE